jgi:glycosyltransferase involved in cell wall biosynthesis
MCTYNGAAYLPDQLASISAQSRRPDEMIVCDDRSTDETIQILKDFARSAPFPVNIIINEKNLGSTKNFEKAIGLCTGEIIALCDQDDIWDKEKLSREVAMLETSPNVGLVFTNAEIVARNLMPLGFDLWDTIHFDIDKQKLVRMGKSFDLLMHQNFVTGCTMAFRAQFREFIFPLPEGTSWIHDGWIALITSAIADLEMIPDCLVKYRQHTGQQLGVELPAEQSNRPVAKNRGLRNVSHYGMHLRHLELVQERLASVGKKTTLKPFVKRRLIQMRAQGAHIRARLALPEKRVRRIPAILLELFTLRYTRFSNGLRSAAIDFLA